MRKIGSVLCVVFFLSIFHSSGQNLIVNSGNSPYVISSNSSFTSITINSGTLTINPGVTVTISGGIVTVSNGVLNIEGSLEVSGTTGPLVDLSGNSGVINLYGELTVGNSGNSSANTVVRTSNGSTFNVFDGGLATLNGSFEARNTSRIYINGTMNVNGNYVGNNSSGTDGTGTLTTTGSTTSNGSSTIFGSTNDCSGPCSGSNTCSFSTTISSAQTICSGNTPLSLTRVTTASNPTYRWQYRTSPTALFVNAPGTNTNATYSPGALTITTQYRLMVTSGGCTQASNVITITVNPIVAITSQPVAQAVCVGASATFSVSASGTNLTYQWRKNGIDITGATSSSYSIPVTTLSDNGASFSVFVNSSCGSLTSNSVTLNVSTPPVILIQPIDQNVCLGNPVVFTTFAFGTDISYQWRKNGANISGANSSTYSISSTTAANAGNYDVVITRNGCSSTSNTVTLTIITSPTISSQPVNQTICEGNPATFSVTANGTGLTYQWRRNGVNIPGATSASYFIPVVSTSDNSAVFSVLVSNTCGSVLSSNAVLTVNPLAIITTQPSNQTVCIGNPVTFSVTASGTGLSYQWFKDNILISGATSATYTIASVTSESGGNFHVRITRNGCPLQSNTAVLIVNSINTWTGTASTNWSTPSNWSCGTVPSPSPSIDADIPSNLVNYPVISVTNAAAKNISIFPTATLTMNNASALQVNGDFVNNGSFTANTGTVNFAGTSSQVISGSSSTTFYNLNINNSGAGVNLGRSVNLNNVLTLGSNAKFTTTGFEFVLISNAALTASIAAIPSNATLTGNIRVQRYIPSSGRYWYHLSSPLSNATVSMLQAGAPTGGFYVTGPFSGASNPGNGIVASGISAYSYNASTATFDRFPVSSNAEILSPGRGYRMFIRDGNAAYNGGVTVAKTISVTGTPNIGNITFNLNYNPNGGNPPGGWNLIGNPYPSSITIDLNASGWISKNNLDGYAAYVWDSDQRRYLSCNGGIGYCTIPAFQGFWVKVNSGGGSLTSSEQVKSNSSMLLYKTTALAPNYVPVTITNIQYGESDIAYLRFEEDASKLFDNQYDAYKLNLAGSGTTFSFVSVSSLAAGTEFSINANPIPAKYDTIPLVVSGYAGEHVLNFSDRTNLNPRYHLYLIDKYKDSLVNLDENPIYHFQIQTNVSATAGQRFDVVLEVEEEIIASVNGAYQEKVSLQPNPIASNSFRIKNIGQPGQPYTITIANLMGVEVFSKSYYSTGELEVILQEKLSPGTYIVTIKGPGKEEKLKLVAE